MNATGVNAGPAESNGSLLLGVWRDSLHVTCGLTACTPGSAPGPTLGNEYGKTCLAQHTARHCRRCGQQSRPSMSFVDNTINLPWPDFHKSIYFGTKFQLEVSSFLRHGSFLKTQRRIGLDRRKFPCQKPLLSVHAFRQNSDL